MHTVTIPMPISTPSPTAHLSLPILHNPLRPTLQMPLTEQDTLIKPLLTRRYVNRRIPLKEIHWLQRNPNNLTRHDREVLNPRYMVNPKLDKHDKILIHDLLVPCRPRPHAGPATRLVRVEPSGVKLVVAVFDGVDVTICEFGAGAVEGLFVREQFLEGRGEDLVPDWFGVDWVERRGILDFEGPIGGGIQVVASTMGEQGVAHDVAGAEGIGGWGARDGLGFGVDETVGVAVEHRVDAQGEDVLVVGCEDAEGVLV